VPPGEPPGAGPRLRARDPRTPDPTAELQELRDREAQLRRTGMWLLGGMAAAVVLVVALSVFLVQRALHRIDQLAQAPPAQAQPERPLPSVVSPDRADPPPAAKAREPAPPATEKPAVEPPAPVEKAPPPPAPRRPAPPTRDRALEVVGGLTAGHLYQSYLNIGMLADAVENEVYTDGEAKKLLATVTSLMDTVDVQLTRLNEAIEDAEDRKRLAQVRQLTALLRAQAKELRGYWDVPAKDVELRKQHELKFHKARDAAWGGIKELLGIQEE